MNTQTPKKASAITSSCVALILTLILMAGTVVQGQTPNRRVRRTLPTATMPNPPAAAPTLRPAFQGFPIDQPQTVDLEIDENTIVGLSKRERMDQILDWLLFTVVADAGLSADVVNNTLFDLPASRRGYMGPIALFEYGATRSRAVGNGRIVALLPQGTGDDTRIDDLAQIADQHRKNLGQMPSSLTVFEYSMDPSGQEFKVTRRADFSARQLFTEPYGYYETKVSNLGDLERFLKQIDDLTYSTFDQGALILGGRKVKGRSYHGLRLEDVAAIWQSEQKIKSNLDSFEAYIKNFDDAWKTFGQAVNFLSKDNVKNANLSTEKLRKMAEAENTRRIFAVAEGGKTWPAAAHTTYQVLVKIIDAYNSDDVETYNELVRTMRPMQERQMTEMKAFLSEKAGKARMVHESGFSLDPTYDFDGLATFVQKEVEPLLRIVAKGVVTADDIAKAEDGLANKNAGPFLLLLDKLRRAGDPSLARTIHDRAQKDYAFQRARYDGELQGTEVGMVLFYTDLLAKLWAIDFMKSTPTTTINEFYPIGDSPLAVTHKANIQRALDTRLWFGPQHRGFQLAGDNGRSVLFARTATRVYAASSDPYKPGAESEANAESAAFLNWWDSHYDEIARYEPEYERLNEIMKWSLVVGWLNNANKLSTLNFLADVTVSHSNVFPEWVRRQPNLRFRDWGKIGFYPAGYKKSDTEALPLLSSKTNFFGELIPITGGVSLAGKKTFAERTPLTSRVVVPEVARRSDVNYSASKTVAGTRQITIENMESANWQMRNSSPNRAEFVATAKKELARRDNAVELPSTMGFKRTTVVNADGISIQTAAGAVPVADLNISKTTNGFRVGTQSRAMDVGHNLARRLSVNDNPEAFLKQAPDVQEAYVHPNSSEFLIKTRGTENWLRLGFEDENPNLAWDSRVADLGNGAGILRLKWISEQQAQTIRARFRVIRDRSTNAGIARVDAYLADNKPVNAMRALEELSANEVSQPDVLLRRAVADLELNRSQLAYTNLQQIFDKVPDVEGFFSEMNARFAANGVLPKGDQFLPVQEGQGITVLYRRQNLGKPLSPNEAKAIDVSGAYLYVQDTPGLGNLDWTPGMESRTLQQVLAKDMGVVIELPSGEIAKLKPAFIKDGGGSGYNSNDAGGGGARSFRSVRQSGPTTPLRTSQIIPCLAVNDNERTRKKDSSLLCHKREEDRRVYVVAAK